MTTDIKITRLSPEPALLADWLAKGKNPVVASALASRGARPPTEILHYSRLKGAVEMAGVLADAIEQRKRLLIVADYDCDGATSCAIGMRGLAGFGADVSFIVPDRAVHGYGLSPAIAELACGERPKPDYIVTVDNGIASHAGVQRAKELGVEVLVTDHHLPGASHPDAKVIVNPNQHGCSFPSKNLAGCGVIWYVMWALRDELARRGANPAELFDVRSLLPLVAVGTIADVVRLDENNRVLVRNGLNMVRRGETFPGIDALAKVAGREPRSLSTTDIGFGIGPRINAAGRLSDMSVGIECLLTDSVPVADDYAKRLGALNDERKGIESVMSEQALADLLTLDMHQLHSLTLHGATWHQGVVGIVAGRVKELMWRPTFVFAEDDEGNYKGSGRSIPGFHLRDALDLVDRRNPGLILKFGGHAMAAGATVKAGGIPQFRDAFEQVARELLTPELLQAEVVVDDSPAPHELTVATVKAIRAEVWGQGFSEPLFRGTFDVLESRLIGDGKHLKLLLGKDGQVFDAVKFRFHGTAPESQADVVFKLDANTWNGKTKVQLLVEHLI